MPLGVNMRPPQDVDLVVSLMGTGTRSLMAQLGLRYAQHLDLPRSEALLAGHRGPWHVPLRAPDEHFESLAQRDKGRTDWALKLLGMDNLIRLTRGRPRTYFYPMTGLSEHIGKGAACGYDATLGLTLLGQWMDPVRASFYREHLAWP